jgi:hypothetical protein
MRDSGPLFPGEAFGAEAARNLKGETNIMKRSFLTGYLLLVGTSAGIHAPTNWTPGSPGSVPNDAIVAGHEYGGEQLFVCRGGQKEGYNIQLGKFRKEFPGCYISWGGQAFTVPDFEVLVSSWSSWVMDGYVPPNAMVGGWDVPEADKPRGPEYYCRAYIDGALQLGKLKSQGSNGCSVPFGGSGLGYNPYQVLLALQPSLPVTTVNEDRGVLPNPLRPEYGVVPEYAIRGGTDVNGMPLYLCSAEFKGPGKLRADFAGCDVSWNGGEYFLPNYQILVTNWEDSASMYSQPPYFDFPAGIDTDGGKMYVCRAYAFSGVHPGKFKNGTCYFGYGNSEYAQSNSFDLLTSH